MKGREFKNIIYSQLAKISKALSDPNRVEIIDLVCQGPRNVEAISKEIDLPFAATSHHLQVLKEARLVKDTKRGRFVYYQVNRSARELFYCLSNIGEDHFSEIQVAMDDFFSKDNKLEKINFNELLGKIKSGRAWLIDVRPEEEYDAGHFPGAVSFPVQEINSRINELPGDVEIIAYCRGRYCVLSHNAISLLKRKKIRADILPEGVNDWLIEGRKLSIIKN